MHSKKRFNLTKNNDLLIQAVVLKQLHSNLYLSGTYFDFCFIIFTALIAAFIQRQDIAMHKLILLLLFISGISPHLKSQDKSEPINIGVIEFFHPSRAEVARKAAQMSTLITLLLLFRKQRKLVLEK